MKLVSFIALILVLDDPVASKCICKCYDYDKNWSQLFVNTNVDVLRRVVISGRNQGSLFDPEHTFGRFKRVYDKLSRETLTIKLF